MEEVKAAMRFRQGVPGADTKAGNPGDNGSMKHGGYQKRTVDDQRPRRAKEGDVSEVVLK
jgi:hypothetical protein